MAGYVIISVLILIVCILLILLVLIQNSKGGGLTSTFSSSNQVLGVKKTADFLEKSTWTMAVALLLLTLSTVFVIDRNTKVDDSGSTTLEFLKNNKTAKPVKFNPGAASTAPQPATQAAPQPATEGEPLPDAGKEVPIK